MIAFGFFHPLIYLCDYPTSEQESKTPPDGGVDLLTHIAKELHCGQVDTQLTQDRHQPRAFGWLDNP